MLGACTWYRFNNIGSDDAYDSPESSRELVLMILPRAIVAFSLYIFQ